ncbi:MAG: UDP-4-amino-4-deoxy-L-arabinose--oxoglutarate aminotransferase [bacterium]|nr:UDP-4-amino-4-deoxy-L-arabinose--oxoglutarate aminotransferase [bacterium]
MLFSVRGKFVKGFEQRFAELVGARFASACASGTAAIHCALAAVDPEPGDEVITTAITDMGALSPILYQGAVPVFADVDPRTYNVTPESIAARITGRTKAIIATHLFGNPCDMTGILEVANKRGIPVIEDCAQAFDAEHAGRKVGTFGAVGCFSLQQGKHITSGEGGIVVSNDEALARRMKLFINKAWPYGEPNPDHTFLALNYRMSEVVGAVAFAQSAKLAEGVRQRIRMARRMTERLQGLPGIETPHVRPGDVHSYWKYCLRVDGAVIPGGSPALGNALKGWEVPSAPRYIQKPAFQCAVFRDQRTFGNSRWPFTLAAPEAVDYSPERFPGTFEALERVIVLPWNERYTEIHVDYVAASIREAVQQLTGGKT